MKYLLDTHSLIWFLENNPKLSHPAKSIIEDLENEIFVSNASWLEISIKVTLGKLILPSSLSDIMSRSASIQIRSIGILESHIIAYQDLHFFDEHRDPFDRIIIVTAVVENFSIITSDPKFKLYQDNVALVW
ncbi:type II toxin-antitoxin system VapC family toxin [Dyadobacter chenwenxiniae]|uniref:Type II toxin-antitoxin system VapC family toxin n=1 Tax=Dyadobacter chenwenxiniae TaxID=2906456 RepID=A0A9X1PIM8_9BACT|nr:type II toxin-antitoxin system VapC family toxin [Dyadobacter chenwenxiniae]MCF0061040.1 type II toxin-antitoxin system VapC family toxin [Dyadobacter chenwenxiniae]UON80868.1 type II toxin-antitoxin system VapC family toxin [Dyadobacter chenwenxiniae]